MDGAFVEDLLSQSGIALHSLAPTDVVLLEVESDEQQHRQPHDPSTSSSSTRPPVDHAEEEGDNNNSSNWRCACVASILGTSPRFAGRYEFAIMTDPGAGLAKTLQAKIYMMGAMLQDANRNSAYQQAISRALSGSSKDRPQIVLDAGAGTGLLSMFAAHASPTTSVVACEMNPALASVAERSVNANQLQDRITILAEHTQGIQDIQADLVVSETMDSLLINEGLIPTMRDCLNRLGKPDAIAIPSKASCFGQLVHIAPGPLRDLVNNQGGLLAPSLESRFGLIGTNKSAVLVQMDSDLVKSHVDTLCSEPQILYSIDFSDKNVPARDETLVTFRVTNPGDACALLVWWSAELFSGIEIDTNPDNGLFQNHWFQALFPLPQVLPVYPTDQMEIGVARNDECMQITTCGLRNPSKKRARVAQSPIDEPDCIPVSELLPNRIDLHRLGMIIPALKRGLQEVNLDLLTGDSTLDIVDLSGLALTPLLVSYPSDTKNNKLQHWTFDSELASLVFNRFLPHNSRRADSLDEIPPGAILVGGMPWECQLDACMAFFHACCAYKGHIARAIPSSATLKCVLIRFAKLQSPFDIPSDILGVNHALCNAEWRHACLEGLLPFQIPLWNYNYSILSTKVSVASLDFAQRACHFLPEPTIERNAGLDVGQGALALASFVDYGFSQTSNEDLCTGPEQGIPWSTQIQFLSQVQVTYRIKGGIDSETNKFKITCQ